MSAIAVVAGAVAVNSPRDPSDALLAGREQRLAAVEPLGAGLHVRLGPFDDLPGTAGQVPATQRVLGLGRPLLEEPAVPHAILTVHNSRMLRETAHVSRRRRCGWDQGLPGTVTE